MMTCPDCGGDGGFTIYLADGGFTWLVCDCCDGSGAYCSECDNSGINDEGDECDCM